MAPGATPAATAADWTASSDLAAAAADRTAPPDLAATAADCRDVSAVAAICAEWTSVPDLAAGLADWTAAPALPHLALTQKHRWRKKKRDITHTPSTGDRNDGSTGLLMCTAHVPGSTGKPSARLMLQETPRGAFEHVSNLHPATKLITCKSGTAMPQGY